MNHFVTMGFLLFLLTLTPVSGFTTDQPDSEGLFGFFLFDSHPQGEVVFDGVSCGNTPAMVKVLCSSNSTHEVTIKIEGYEDYSRQLTENPEPGQTVPITLQTNLIMNIRNFLSEENRN